ncbi:hypothetical protein LRP49_01825 [Enterovibrio sp. ZSDZ35]|uniref:P/Homo B domain-containing protein n=1 Tax=Enterovibrio qingdaonensis TaxID=2899818 RepID=A0ABT5QGZ4_9GAMM|nr:hypothetical protein [Enterovibrio sp. ZSDZ35]MDD1779924.1 hypothetical protein [Enterovibrio sp. ZSDZ35]
MPSSRFLTLIFAVSVLSIGPAFSQETESNTSEVSHKLAIPNITTEFVFHVSGKNDLVAEVNLPLSNSRIALIDPDGNLLASKSSVWHETQSWPDSSLPPENRDVELPMVTDPMDGEWRVIVDYPSNLIDFPILTTITMSRYGQIH